jgi:hypothetical protein
MHGSRKDTIDDENLPALLPASSRTVFRNSSVTLSNIEERLQQLVEKVSAGARLHRSWSLKGGI